jgi:sugar lactone lactonase YvrE
MCNGGSCQPGLIKMCADLDSCTNDKCDPASGNCVFTPIVGCGGNCGTTADCNDSNPCTDDACTAGKCTFANNAVACDDKNKCTTSDVCSSGSCKGGPALNCDDLNPCTNDSCNASTGCQNVANTALCDDGNACTTGDICQQSVCKGGAAPNCDDGLPCTTDTCNSATGCVSAANTAACDDGDKCTTNDVCANSKCVAGPALVCNDNNPCTSDTCAASSGCQFPALPDGIACDDGSPCTMGDMCVNGSCSQGKAVWVDLFAGTVVNGASQAGFVDGAVGVGKFKSPAGLAFDRATGTLYVADSGSHAIRKVNAQGVVSTLAGTGVAGAEDNVGNKASFNEPRGVAVDSKGNVYVADRLNSRIRKIEPDGTVTTVSGGAGAGLVNGPIEKAKYMYPRGIAVASTGQLVVADTENHAIRVLDLAAGTVSTVAGSGSAGFQNGIGPSAMFNFPVALSLDEDNRAYVADQYNQRIRRVSPNGQVETIAGSGTAGFVDSTVDSTLGQFNMPQGIVFTLTASGPMGFIADTNNGRVRKMFPNNLVTLAGGGAGGLADGTGGSVSFNSPGGVAVDGSGFVYVSDTGKNVIRRIRDTAAPCSISGVCYVAGTLSSTTSCLACQPVNNKGDWSPVTGATTCSDGNPCTQNDACDNGKCTAGSSGPNCDDGNVCTNDACDAGSGKCVNTPGNNQAACSDTSPCTINEYCSNGTCVSGGAKCNDNNPCTTDFCNIIGNCVYTAVAYGTSCTPSSGNQTQGFCADTVCTGLEQSAAILQGTSTNSYRVTSVGRDQNNTLYATGFGKKADSNTNTTVFALQGDTPGVVPAAGVDMVTPGAGMEFWASAYRLITGGFNSFGNNDNSNIFAASYQSGWVYNAFTQPSSTNEYRIFRHAALLNFGGAEHYFYGGKPESGVTSTNLFHAQYNGSQWKTFGGTSGTWSGAASQVGRMNLFSSTDCLQGQMLKADIVGITAFTTSIGSGTQMFVAYNTASNGALPGVASSDYIGTSSCINLSPGGPVMLASATGTRGMFAPASTIQMTGVHGVSLSRVIAVGWDSAKSFPVVYSYTGSGGTWTVEAPSPPIPVGSPDATGNSVYSNFGVGPYRPTSVVLNGDDAWIAGRHASNTCSTMWVMHGRHDGNKWNWDKLLTSAATAKHCVSVTGGASNLLVSRVWYDTVKGNVFVSGAAGFDANGGAIIASGAASTQKGVVWRIQTK